MKKIMALMPLVLLVALAGCGDDGTPAATDGGGGTTDTTPPGVAGVTAVDQFHISVTFSEAVQKAQAERTDNYIIIQTTTKTIDVPAAAAPGDTLSLSSAALAPDNVTVTLTTDEPMSDVGYSIEVVGVRDLSGNASNASSTFTGSVAADTTPPTIVARSPAPNATNVGIGESVSIQFSEQMNSGSVAGAFSWTSTGGVVGWQMDEQDANVFLFTPTVPLANNTTYTIDVAGSAQDWAGNNLATSTWTFRTTAMVDVTPPTLVSTVPAHQAVNVDVNTSLVLNFSEPIDQVSLEDVVLTPSPGDGVDTWTNNGATITFDPDLPLADNTQYTLIILQGDLRDLAGNASTETYQVVFTTGLGFEQGGFSGTISGDPTSPAATNPAGALVVAAINNPMAQNEEGIDFSSSTVVENNGTYVIQNLADGTYFPLSALDSNGDNDLNPENGDAFGIYGVISTADTTADSLQVVGGIPFSNVNFQLFDAMAISGLANYTGAALGNYGLYFGLFDTTGFDLGNLGSPDYTTEGFWPFDPEFTFNEFDDGLMAGTYYVGAYLDLDGDTMLDEGVDPLNFYTNGGGVPVPMTVANGSDYVNAMINLTDPVVPAKSGRATVWKGTRAVKRSPWADLAHSLTEFLKRR